MMRGEQRQEMREGVWWNSSRGQMPASSANAVVVETLGVADNATLNL